MKLTERQLTEIVQEEIYIYLIQEAWEYDQWGGFKNREEWATHVLTNPEKYTREEVWDAEQLEKEDFPEELLCVVDELLFETIDLSSTSATTFRALLLLLFSSFLSSPFFSFLV